MPLDALGGAPEGLDEFRVSSAREIAELLRRLCDGSHPLNLNARDGSVADATVWTIGAERGVLGLSVQADDPAVQTMMESQDGVAVGYLDNVKLQFDLHNLVLVRGERASVLRCNYPREMLRLQRRNAFRVRPPLRGVPVARVRHTDIAEMHLTLRVLDVSISGCALFLPNDVPPMQVGGVINQVELELDADTRFCVDLRLQHVTSLNGDANGVRIGCEFVRTDVHAMRALQRFIDQTQKRGKLLAIH